MKKDTKRDEVLQAHGISPRFKYQHAFNGFSARMTAQKVEGLKHDPRVELVEQDLEVHALTQTIPTGIRRIGANLNPIAKIDGIDERVNVDIAILDTGIDLTHPDLKVYQHVTFVTNTTTGNDDHGHGTHVAGTAAALDNGIGVVGVAPGARLWAVKVLDSGGSGTGSAIIAGVDYVTQHALEIEVANMSLGGMGLFSSLRTAIQNSVAKGVVYVVAAGNSDVDVYGGDLTFGTSDDQFPACYPEVMAVSAIVDTDAQAGGTGPVSGYGPDDTMATFSNYSVAVVANNPVTSPGRAIDVAAPGMNIYSTYKGGLYATMSGTSMATPHVAGIVALYMAQYGRAHDANGVYTIRQAIINGAQDPSSWGPLEINPQNKLFDFYKEGLAAAVDPALIPGSVQNHPPMVSIISPSSGSTYPYETIITITATASDAEDGTLVPSIMSSIDGYLGTSNSTNVKLSVGTHSITSTAEDSRGLATTSSAITITVTGNYHPADTTRDWHIDVDEATLYGSCYKTSCTWPAAPNPVPVDYVTNAGFVWRNPVTGDSSYHYDPDPAKSCTNTSPQCFVAG